MTDAFVLLAGGTGDLGGRIARALVAREAPVHAFVRSQSSPEALDDLRKLGVTVVPVDLSDLDAVTRACQGASCVVSALSGLRDVILDRQTVLLDAAVRAGVPRFISSDYCADYTKTEPGHNRNFDLRREFAGRADRAPIRVTSIFNGAFMDMLGA
ncbi:MAG: NmrA family NAD(P)-binding protein, partial [Pseudonocardiales bacterium]|nr:NmrA family NAD(P)-binding protein [Pseudonocardiales bacterium]